MAVVCILERRFELPVKKGNALTNAKEGQET
jgi:hypothetical protein